MRLLFVNWAFENHGSAQDLYHYARVARMLGHEVALYGPPDPASPFNYSLDVEAAEAVIFIFEFSTWLDRLDAVRLAAKVPRRYRVVIDCDGKYNEAVSVTGDMNHLDESSSRRWREVCDSLSDKIYQPTFHPQRPNVGTFFFHAYNPDWERSLDFRHREFGMMYVGSNWFRWRPLRRVLQVIEPIRDRVGRIGLIGEGWSSVPERHDRALLDLAHYSEPDYLKRLDVEVLPPVRFDHVVEEMGRAVFSPVIYRPLFDQLQLVTCRTFETPAAGALPLFTQGRDFVTEVYGDEAEELILPDERGHEKILDLLRRPEYYADIVRGLRRRLAEKHCYELQLKQLIEIVRS